VGRELFLYGFIVMALKANRKQPPDSHSAPKHNFLFYYEARRLEVDFFSLAIDEKHVCLLPQRSGAVSFFFQGGRWGTVVWSSDGAPFAHPVSCLL